MSNIAIIAASRTPIGKLGGSLASLSAVDLGVNSLKATIARTKLQASQVEQVIMGNVLQAGSGQNVARQVGLKSGLSESSTAMTVNQVCASGLKAIRLGETAIKMGDAKIVAVGGTESMSNAPFLIPNHRFGHLLGNDILTDSLLSEGLIDAFSGDHMGITAENVAEKYGISRQVQDEFALSSQQKAQAASEAGFFDAEKSAITINGKKETITVSADEAIRSNSRLAKMGQLKAAFKAEGTVTAGNASGLNDGAASLLLMDEAVAEAEHQPVLGLIRGYTEVGVDPQMMGIGPVPSIQKLLQQTNHSLADIDLFELNEAFAAQSVVVQQELGIPVNQININGGAIALGHPIGASGARIVVTLLHNLARLNLRYGIASLCVGGGMGVSMLIERPLS